jgi:large subunit ribosomal protein L9
MEIILKTDIKGLGYKNDLVSVKPGYGRNYLIPQGFAVLATGSNKKSLLKTSSKQHTKPKKSKQKRKISLLSLPKLHLKSKRKSVTPEKSSEK